LAHGALHLPISNTNIGVFENFALVLWSAVLSDLGVTSQPNILTDPELMRKVIHLGLDVPQGIELSWINGTAADFVLSNMTEFKLPFNNTQAASFNARYLYRKMWWKTPTNLAVDVIVATVSFFLLFWAVLQLALRYLAVKSSANGQLFTFVFLTLRY
jgi:hypothetical protein